MLRFADLKYSDTELENDAIHYLTTQMYEPAFADKVKKYLADDLADFKNYYDDNEYAFHNIYYDEFVTSYVKEGDNIIPWMDLNYLSNDMEKDFRRLNMSDEEVEDYAMYLVAEFRKNAFFSHMEPYFLGYDAVVATVVSGYSRNPVFSIYSIVREWAMALHLKKMYPQLTRKFGYNYQNIREKYSGDERLRRLIDYRDKYKLTIRNINALRAVHSSVFAYTYLYLRAVLSQEATFIEDFIMDNASSQIFLLLQGENIQNVDFMFVKHALKQLKQGRCKELINPDASIDWDGVYDFVTEVINDVGGISNLRDMGVDGIQAKTIRSFWNKSANLQKMLKILRRLAMDNNDPIINSLIEMCEYRLGRPSVNRKERMERFLEETRRLVMRQSYEITRPRTMAQELIAAFPSVFLVYFQWHHNFRTIYPKFPAQEAYKAQMEIDKRKQLENNSRQRADNYEKTELLKKRDEYYNRERKQSDRQASDKLSFVMNEDNKLKQQKTLNEKNMRESINIEKLKNNQQKEQRNTSNNDLAIALNIKNNKNQNLS